MSDEKKAYALMQSISSSIQEKRLDGAREQCYRFLDLCSEGQEAVKVAQLLVQLDRNNAEAYNLLGISLFSVGKWSDSGKAYARAMSINPDYGMAIMNYANLILRLGQIKEAVAYFERALQKLDFKYHATVYLNMANIYLDSRQFDKALELARKAEKLDKKNAGVYALLGNIYTRMADNTMAEKNYLKAIQLDDCRLSVLDNLACLYDRLHDIEKVKYYLRKSFDLRKKILGNTDLHQWTLIAGMVKSLYALHFSEEVTGFSFDIVQGKNLDSVLEEKPEYGYKRVDNRNSIVVMDDIAVVPNGWHIIKGTTKYSNMAFHVAQNAQIWAQADCLGRSIMRRFEKEETVEEPVIIMGGAANYYHWICDYLPRLEMLRHCPELDAVPVVLNGDLASFQTRMLDMLGFDLSRIQCFNDDTLYHLKKAYILHQSGRPMINNHSDWMNPAVTKQDIDWLRTQFKPWMKPTKSNPKRLFLSREGAKFRRCVNEAEVFALAQQYGFEKVRNEDLSFENQIALYAGVDAVMGVHGAGFTNMVFAPESARIIELHSKGELPPFYTHMATLIGQEHYTVEGLVTQALLPLTPPFWDFEVDMDTVKQTLDRLG